MNCDDSRRLLIKRIDITRAATFRAILLILFIFNIFPSFSHLKLELFFSVFADVFIDIFTADSHRESGLREEVVQNNNRESASKLDN